MLTRKQSQTFDFIKSFFQENDFAPTMAEIAKGIGIKSRGVVHRYVQALSQEGLLRVIPNKRRNIELTNSAEKSNWFLPIVGNIAAGSPIEAIPQQEALDISHVFLSPKRYALRVKGDSMIEEGIFDGDLVVCEHSDTAVNGQIVVALVDGLEATLKRLQINPDNTVTLIPANARLSPMVYSADRIQIQGIFIGLMRFA